LTNRSPPASLKIKNLKEYPRKKNGKKKSIVVD